MLEFKDCSFCYVALIDLLFCFLMQNFAEIGQSVDDLTSRSRTFDKTLKLDIGQYDFLSDGSRSGFLQRDAMQARPMSSLWCLSVRLSVCLTRSYILSKRINISSEFFHNRVTTPFQFFLTKRHSNILTPPP